MAKPNDYVWGVGRRKTSVARVRIREGSGKITINGKAHTEYFRLSPDQARLSDPLRAVQAEGSFDVWANIKGGGTTGQVGAVVMGLSRALARVSEENEAALRKDTFLTRDSRMVERKKPGRKKARKSFQFSKR
ncbi:MAG: 30S ribosomal protein S9 [Planctomycetes bacterium]|nr:30S ribosomal protein S9 [Planctomycetota bacterium]MBT6452643.1 30S ribosomal protein S9 [Planctomycetota bacterium]MBT6541346.1 30S ribosomal protein S9 [Planctomycetota bacterium]MBT6785614.1 30S ribosomal protein S9 [Planctomycetota bacterium]MBT6967604.1 30S ribosomal protein S9 [Planctomycetota bacterium]